MEDKYTVSYAQNREDIILSAFFLNKKKGFYVDVGANDPVEHSVTKYFYDRGWSGINIEPNPALVKKLELARPRDISLNVGVSDKKDNLLFRQYEGHGLSTFSSDTMHEHEADKLSLAKKYIDYTVEVDRLDSILAPFAKKHIDFMKIDVEGYEYEVIVSNNWKLHRPKVLCIEANHIYHDWHKILKENNYIKVFHDGLNEYFIDNEQLNIEDFRYLDSAVGRSIVTEPVYADLKKLQHENKKLERMAKVAESKNKSMIQEVSFLKNELYTAQGVKAITKKLIRATDRAIESRLEKLNDNKKANIKKKHIGKGVIKGNKIESVNLWIHDLESFYSTNDFRFKRPKAHARVALSAYRQNKKTIRKLVKKVQNIKNGANK